MTIKLGPLLEEQPEREVVIKLGPLLEPELEPEERPSLLSRLLSGLPEPGPPLTIAPGAPVPPLPSVAATDVPPVTEAFPPPPSLPGTAPTLPVAQTPAL